MVALKHVGRMETFREMLTMSEKIIYQLICTSSDHMTGNVGAAALRGLALSIAFLTSAMVRGQHDHWRLGWSSSLACHSVL